MPARASARSPRLVLDLNATASAWRLCPDARIEAAVPDGWEMRVVRGPNVSDGDGTIGRDDERSRRWPGPRSTRYGMSPRLLEVAPGSLGAERGGGVRRLLSAMRDRDVLLTNAAGITRSRWRTTCSPEAMHFLRGFDVRWRASGGAVGQARGGAGRVRPNPTAPVVREVASARLLVSAARGDRRRGRGAVLGARGRDAWRAAAAELGVPPASRFAL
jgi:hypothetical protein